MVQMTRKSTERKAGDRRKITERKKTPLKLPKSKSINLRASKQTSATPGRTRKSGKMVASNRPSTSGSRSSKKYSVQPLRFDITAINIPHELRRPVIIDGENVAFDHQFNIFNIDRISSAIQYFEGIGHRVLVFCPDYLLEKMPTLDRLGRVVELIPNCSGNPEYNQNMEEAMLQRANDEQAAIVSERRFHNTFQHFYEIVTERVIGFTIFRDVIFIPVDPYGRAGPWLRTILSK